MAVNKWGTTFSKDSWSPQDPPTVTPCVTSQSQKLQHGWAVAYHFFEDILPLILPAKVLCWELQVAGVNVTARMKVPIAQSILEMMPRHSNKAMTQVQVPPKAGRQLTGAEKVQALESDGLKPDSTTCCKI